jgi:uncharacterized OB-fold protein
MISAGVSLGLCTRCGASYFPRRLMCARCGSIAWEHAVAREGVVEEVTTVHRRIGGSLPEPVVLATVRLAGGQRIVARLNGSLARETPVLLHEQGGAVRAAERLNDGIE